MAKRILLVVLTTLLCSTLVSALPAPETPLRPALGNQIEANVFVMTAADGTRTFRVERAVDVARQVARGVKREVIRWEIDAERGTFRAIRERLERTQPKSRIASLDEPGAQGGSGPDLDFEEPGAARMYHLRQTAYGEWLHEGAFRQFRASHDISFSVCITNGVNRGVILHRMVASCFNPDTTWQTTECSYLHETFNTLLPDLYVETRAAFQRAGGASSLAFVNGGDVSNSGIWYGHVYGALTGQGSVTFFTDDQLLGTSAAQCGNNTGGGLPGEWPPVQQGGAELIVTITDNAPDCVTIKVNGAVVSECCAEDWDTILKCVYEEL